MITDAIIDEGLRLDGERTDPEFGPTRPLQFFSNDSKIWYDDCDLCAEVYDNMGIGVCGIQMAEFLTHCANHYAAALREIRRLRKLCEPIQDARNDEEPTNA